MKTLLLLYILTVIFVPYLTRYIFTDVYPTEVEELIFYDYDNLDKYIHDCYRVSAWININIYYQAEPEGQDIWQSSKKTLKKKSGDCDDFAVLFDYLIRRKYWFLPVQYQVIRFTDINQRHVMVKVGDYIYGEFEGHDYVVEEKHGTLYAWYRQTFPQLAELLRRIL